MIHNELIRILKQAEDLPPKLRVTYEKYINEKESDQKLSQAELKTIYELLNDYNITLYSFNSKQRQDF
jgi:hypothetical protein